MLVEAMKQQELYDVLGKRGEKQKSIKQRKGRIEKELDMENIRVVKDHSSKYMEITTESL